MSIEKVSGTIVSFATTKVLIDFGGGSVDYYPICRTEPDLYLNIVSERTEIEGEYKWGTNCSHLLFDCLGDYFSISFFLNSYDHLVRIYPNTLADEIVWHAGGSTTRGITLPEGHDLEKTTKLSHIINPWRYNGYKHKYIYDCIRSGIVPEKNSNTKNFLIKRRPRVHLGHKYARNIHNEDLLLNRLLFLGFGFEVIYLEDLSFVDQVSKFSCAENIIATHGSGLVWSIFCNSNTKIVELLPPYFYREKSIKSDFWYISQHGRVQHTQILCTNVVGSYYSPYDNDVVADVDLIADIIVGKISLY